jgi:hypothetical protein
VRQRQTSKRPARLSVSPWAISSGAEPSSTTLSGRFARVSSSHRRFTVSDQPGIFWISSSTSTAPFGTVDGQPRRFPLLGDPVRAAQGGLVRAGLAHGQASASVTCCTRVDLPTWRGPATTWMKRRGSASRAASTVAAGAGKGFPDLLVMMSIFTQWHRSRVIESNRRTGSHEHFPIINFPSHRLRNAFAFQCQHIRHCNRLLRNMK